MNLDLYRRLFVWRDDVFAEQHASGAYTPVKRPLTDDDIAAHLSGDKSFGVYVIKPGGLETVTTPPEPDTVHYVVFDLDTYNADALSFLTRAVERLVAPKPADLMDEVEQLKCLLLEDSGGKGYHIWLFLDAPTPAAKVRAWTDLIKAQYVGMANTLAPGADRWPALEVFPKQDAVPEGGFGNLVKLPLGRHAKSGARSMLVERAGWACTLADVVPHPAALIPEPKQGSDGVGRNGSSGRYEGGRGSSTDARVPFACIAKLKTDGAPNGCRDKAMYHLAAFYAFHGMDEDLALEQCRRDNEASDQPLTDREVRTKVASAYRREKPAGCANSDWLDSFCPGDEYNRKCPNYVGDGERDSAAPLSEAQRNLLRGGF